MKSPARKHFEPLLSPYVDGELSPEERQEVEKHLQADKESAAQVADFRAAAGLIRLSLEQEADQQDWSNFSNEVLAKLTPHKPPFFERLSLTLSELFTYRRGTMVAAMAGAAAALAIGVPVAMKLGSGGVDGYANSAVEVQVVQVEQSSKVRPVVLETEKGDAIIWMADEEDEAKKNGQPNEATHEELELELPKGEGEL